MRIRHAVRQAAVLVVSSGTLIAILGAAGCRRVEKESPAPKASVLPPAPASPVPAGAPTSFSALASAADPAVVFVKTLQADARHVIGEGQGTGFVFDPNGLILTNNHVIDGAREIEVIFPNHRALRAEVVGRDGPTDVAVLRVKEKGLSFVPLGDSDAVRVGDWVVAIGNPFGLSHTVSAGIISAKGRTREDVQLPGDSSGYYNFLQTDASINPGNSGGPLIDLTSRVVGINTAIRQQANSIGFAIPINMVRELLPQLIDRGHVQRSAIGIHVSTVLPEDVERLGLERQGGALVRQVIPGGPADAAGIKPDDVIVAFDGVEVASPERLRWTASLAGVGRTVSVRVARGKQVKDLPVTLVELPEPRPVPVFGVP